VEVRDELRDTQLAGITAVLDVAYRRLMPLAQSLLSYLAAFRLPFSREQIVMLLAPETQASAGNTVSAELAKHWSAARDELVQASFIQFDGRVYTIHAQVRNFALSYLPMEERRRVHRVVATYYRNQPQPSPEEWFVAYDYLEGAGEAQDLQEAVRLAVDASWAMNGRGHAQAVLGMLRRAEVHALSMGNKTGEGQIQCCLGAILRQLGQYGEAIGCLMRSLSLHREQHERDESAHFPLSQAQSRPLGPSRKGFVNPSR